MFFMKFFVRHSWLKVENGRQEIELRLFITLQVSYYFTRPLIAIVNQILKFSSQVFYEDNFYKATMYGYWGVMWSCLGCEKWSRASYELCFRYFNAHPHPVQQGFFLMTQGYVLEFPLGNLKESQEKLESSLKVLSGVGEAFARFIAL